MIKNEKFEQKIFDGVMVRRCKIYYNFWVAEDGRILGPRGKWLNPVIDSAGYQTVKHYFGQRKVVVVKVHHLVGETYVLNPDSEAFMLVDHISGIRHQNAASGLRWTDRRGNGQNRLDKKEGRTSSRYVGVNYHKSTGKYQTQIFINKKQTFLGIFVDEADAGRAYDAALAKLGRAPVNFPQ